MICMWHITMQLATWQLFIKYSLTINMILNVTYISLNVKTKLIHVDDTKCNSEDRKKWLLWMAKGNDSSVEETAHPQWLYTTSFLLEQKITSHQYLNGIIFCTAILYIE